MWRLGHSVLSIHRWLVDFLSRGRGTFESGRDCCCKLGPRRASCSGTHPIWGGRDDSPNIPRVFQLHADLLQFPRTLGRVDGPHSCANRRRLRLDIQSHDLQCNPRANAVVVPRRIPASVKVQAGRDGSLHKRLAHAVLTEDDQRYRPLNARAAPGVFPTECLGGLIRDDWPKSPPKKCSSYCR